MKTLNLARTVGAGALAASALCPTLMAQQASPVPPVRLLSRPTAQSKATFGLITSAQALPGGRVIVNDVLHRQLVLLDSSLTGATVIADSTSGSANAYGTRPGGLLGYAGDSSLFVVPATLSMLVIDPAGAVARVASVPRAQDATALANSPEAAFDGQHRLVYRQPARLVFTPPADKGPMLPNPPDSAFIVGIDVTTRKLDTVASFKIPQTKFNVSQTEGGGTSITNIINPLPVTDDWAVLSDGTIAIVHAQDVHIDWIGVDGTRTSTGKIPFDWRRLSDDDKAAVVDSAKAAIEKARAAATNGGAAGGMRMQITVGGGGGGGIPAGLSMSMPTPQVMSASELPDYRPPFAAGGIKADRDDNLWIRTTQIRPNAIGAGTIYDVIDRHGVLVDRIEIPAGRTIVAFGKGGVIYMAARDDSGAWLERAQR
jgi:hypothetical protein